MGIIPITLYSAGMMLVLLPTLTALKTTFFVYLSTISIMQLCTMKGCHNGPLLCNSCILLVAISFVILDSLLAFDTFYVPLQQSSFLIMSNYALEQYLIVIGILGLNIKKVAFSFKNAT